MNKERSGCVTVEDATLRRELETRFADTPFNPDLSLSHPHLFAATPIFSSAQHILQMVQLIDAVEKVVALPAYRTRVLEWAPEIARFEPEYYGVFYGYDFHLGSQGSRLIEINTNAGGALLNALLARAQISRACTQGMSMGPVPPERLDDTFAEMFLDVWRAARGAAPLHGIALVDEAPRDQHLYPEFLLFQKVMQSRGIATVIADPRELNSHEGALWYGTQRIDLVYNRLTDFALAAPHLSVLKAAYLNREVVLTPHPRGHALYADKRNLCVLSNREELRALGVTESHIETLYTCVPRTIRVNPENAAQLWTERRRWFFKPVAGYGGKAIYRGDKLTKRVWGEILTGKYIAQKTVPPGECEVEVHGQPVALKFDVRNYVYRGAVQLISARLYAGQTTNLRTPGGGFTPVYSTFPPFPSANH